MMMVADSKSAIRKLGLMIRERDLRPEEFSQFGLTASPEPFRPECRISLRAVAELPISEIYEFGTVRSQPIVYRPSPEREPPPAAVSDVDLEEYRDLFQHVLDGGRRVSANTYLRLGNYSREYALFIVRETFERAHQSAMTWLRFVRSWDRPIRSVARYEFQIASIARKRIDEDIRKIVKSSKLVVNDAVLQQIRAVISKHLVGNVTLKTVFRIGIVEIDSPSTHCWVHEFILLVGISPPEAARHAPARRCVFIASAFSGELHAFVHRSYSRHHRIGAPCRRVCRRVSACDFRRSASSAGFALTSRRHDIRRGAGGEERPFVGKSCGRLEDNLPFPSRSRA
jgi:hypothetical protein